METKEILQKYEFEDFVFVTHFKTFNDAEEYAEEHHGELVEIGFLDGADNPEMSDKANLILERKPFKVELPQSNYEVYYSYDENFQDYLLKLQIQHKRLENDMYPEDILADQNLALGDKILIMDQGAFVAITTRERIKFLMRGNLYEIAVKLPNNEKD